MRHVWKEEKSNLLNYFEKEKLNLSEVAKIYKTTKIHLLAICRRLGINHLVEPTTPWTEEEIDLVRKLYFKGSSISSIAKKLPNKTKEEVNFLCINRKEELNIVREIKKRPPREYSENDINEIRNLVNDGYTRFEIGDMLGIDPSVILELKRKHEIKKPSIQELHDRGIFYIGYDKKRVDTGLTKEKLISLLEEGKSRREIARLYNIDSKLVGTLSKDLGMNDKRRVRANNLKRRLILEITGKEASKSDLRKGFVNIFTKEYVEELLKRHGYCMHKCAVEELDGIDDKCLYEAIKKFNIEIPEDLKEETETDDLWRDLPLEEKRLAHSLGEYRTRKALEELSLEFIWQVFRPDIVPKNIRPIGVSIDFSVIYNEKLYYIEFNGPMHYNLVSYFRKTTLEKFVSQVKRDMWVKKYCNENNIVFIEIPYTVNSIKKIKSLLQKVIIEGQDINNIIDYEPFYKEIKERGITIED